MADRARRVTTSKLDKLAEYKRAREGGKRVLKEEDSTIYDEVTEDQYKSIVRGRLQKDDFVVDDGVEGYMDNGMDDWMDEEESEEEIRTSKKSKKKAQDTSAKSKARPKPPPPPAAPTISAYRPVVSAEQENDFMSSLLGELGKAPAKVPKSRKRKPVDYISDDDVSSPSSSKFKSYRKKSSYVELSSDGPVEDSLPPSDDEFSPKKRMKLDDGSVTPATEQLAGLDVHSSSDFDSSLYDDIDFNEPMDIDEIDAKPVVTEEPKPEPLKPPATNGKASEVKPTKPEEDVKPSWLSVYDSLNVESQDSLGPIAASSLASTADIAALEEDGSFRFFWLDYLELEGKIYFIGKLKDKKTGAWVSCCVTVEGLERNLFCLPREKRVEQDEDGDFYDTDIVPSLEDVYADFELIRKQLGIKSWRAKFVKRKYAFGEKDVPRNETQWLKVVYGFNEPQVPAQAESPNISRMFGTSTSPFELLVLKRKIMGPCWLQIKKPILDNKGVSWCKLEVTVSDPKDINPISDSDPELPKDTPPLTIMSLSVRSIVNHHDNKREIVCTSSRTWQNLHIDDPIPPDRFPCRVQTFVRPLDRFPPNFEARARANGKGKISAVTNETMVLNQLIQEIYKMDPDVIVGHEFLGVSLDILLHRMRDLQVRHWSRLGRFRRSKWPGIGRQGTNLKFLNGRMLCDLASDGARSMIASTTWSLTEMCRTHLNFERPEIDPDDTASYLDGSLSTPNRMLEFVQHCELDAHYQMAIAAKVQILPLTKQLTNLAGNAWNKTLNGGRAERNEYILLHEFHRLKYVVPDKQYGKKAAPVVKQDDDDAEAPKTTKGKRDKYKGGLVFEPKRGLWDKFILVMDFNSLYPSIIQEYNIDFTTVDQFEVEENGEEKIPDPPPSETPQGVLPRLIATLVQRRRQVKSLMKDKSAPHAKLLQYDIKQQALKLTANSMYGCLGFEYSRFYARPLAALTTYKGREILTHTRELAESLNLDVVYGDTDSIFVNSGVTELAEALKISSLLKKAVNDRYKLLEIDLDGVFQRLLLLQKKKYAALVVEDGGRTKTEIKGLDMKRREYCALSKNVSQYVLDQVLSGEPTEIVVENIHEYLTTVGENVRNGSTKLEEFIIFKRLGKNPEDYPDAKSQPHVQVALRMKTRGGSARAGDVISYVFCIKEGEDSSKSAQADRAKHPDEVRKATDGLKIDFDFYLSQQVLPPIERLCEPIEGTDRSRLAECLGLDPMRFRNTTSGGPDERAFIPLDSQLSDHERFKDASPFLLQCRGCKGLLSFAPLHDREQSIVQPTGFICPGCQAPFSLPSIETQLEVQIREVIGRYYEGWTVCDDPTCRNRTRMMSVYGRRCLKQGCRGSVVPECTDKEVYNQLRYYSYLFDGTKAIKAATGSTTLDAVSAVVGKNGDDLKQLTECVDKHLDKCGHRWVDLKGSIKSHTGPAATIIVLANTATMKTDAPMNNSVCPRCGCDEAGLTPIDHIPSPPIKNDTTIEERVSLLDLEISKLNEQRAQLLRERNELKSPMHKCLPFEILSDIFRFVSPPVDFKARHFDTSEMVPRVNGPYIPGLSNWEINGPYLPVILSSICSYWRQVARATPELWTTLALEVRGRTAANHGRLIQLYISRSKYCPVSVELDFRKEQKAKWAEPVASRATALETALRPIRNVLFHPKARTRIAMLRLIAPPCQWLPSLPSITRLEHISLGWPFRFCVRPTSAEEQDHDLSDLRHLSHVTLSRSLKVVLPWSQITNLKLMYLPITTCLELLFRCENLRKCRVRHPYPDDPGSQAPAFLQGGPVTLKHLRFLEWQPISTPAMLCFFQRLNLPTLRALRWEGNGGLWGSGLRTAALDFFSRLPTTMITLELIGEIFPTTQRPDSVRGLLNTLPQLEHLILNGIRSEVALGYFFAALASEDEHERPSQPALRVLEFRNADKVRLPPTFDFKVKLLDMLRRRYLRSDSGLVIRLDVELKWSEEQKEDVRELGKKSFQIEFWEGRLANEVDDRRCQIESL